MPSYEDKSEAYFANARREIGPLLPNFSGQVLEIGCGAGETLAWLKQEAMCGVTVGIELFEEAANRAKRRVDQIHVGNAEALISTSTLQASAFDLILCLDVLEHMVDPWQFVKKATEKLSPTGILIASIPNIRNISVIAPLLFRADWRYQPEGILDQTHLRFFTKKTAIELIEGGGLKVEKLLRVRPPRNSKKGMLDTFSLGLFKDFLTQQFLISAKR